MKRMLIAVISLLVCLGSSARAQEEKMEAVDLSSVQLLDLATAQRFALAGNPDIAAAQARFEQASARVRQATAAWWPSLDLTGVGSKQRLSDSAYQSSEALQRLMGGSADKTTDNFSAGLQASWILFDGFFRTFKEQLAQYDEQSESEALINSRRLLVTSVAEAYLNAQLAQTNVDIARADEQFYIKQLQDAENRYEVGAGAWGDVLNIKVQLNSAKTSLMLNQRQYEAAGYGLAALLGIPEALLPSHVRLEQLDRDFVTPAFQEDPEKLIKDAMAARPDIRRLEMVVKQAEAATGLAKAPYYPQVQLAGAVNGARQGDTSLTGDDLGNTVSINMAWNLFSGGEDKARISEAQQLKRETMYTLANLRNGVAAEIRQDLALLAAADEQVRLQRETVLLVKENRDLARNEYEAGEASLIRLNEAQRDLNTTYGRLAQSLVSYHLARERLLSATGRNLAAFDQAEGSK